MIFGVHPPWTLYFDLKKEFWAELPAKWPIYPFLPSTTLLNKDFWSLTTQNLSSIYPKNEFSQGILNLGYAY